MNKDVIYIEPEDDITDIITKIEKSKEKIVALVPPKKAGIFRSIVNMKLIAKSGAAAKKTIVLVTVDPSILKLAGAVKMPVTKDLQTAPTIPHAEEEVEEKSTEKLAKNLGDEDTAEEESEEGEVSEEDGADDAERKEEDEEKEEAEDGEESDEEKKPGKGKKNDKKGAKAKNWFTDHKRLVIFSGIGGLLLILVLVWALIIAPKATLTVGIRTGSNNFSEGVTFSAKLEEENSSEGKFYLDEKKSSEKAEAEFEATGKKNVGQKAKGEVIIYYYFPITEENGGKVVVDAGAAFTISGLTFTSDDATYVSWDGDLGTIQKDCENYGQPSLRNSGCLVSRRIPVTAGDSGEKYNIAPAANGWSTTAKVGVYSDKAMSGGTDEYITVVTQADIDKAKNELSSTNESESKKKLLEDIREENENAFIIESSFKRESGDVVSTPKVGEEVKSGEKAKISVTTTSSVFVLDEVKVKEFITEKAKISESQKIYDIKDPFIENFMKSENGYTGKLKTSYTTGPKITENDVINIVKGKGLGEAQHDLKDIEGVASIKIDVSYPWVMSIPSDPNKVTVILEVQE